MVWGAYWDEDNDECTDEATEEFCMEEFCRRLPIPPGILPALRGLYQEARKEYENLQKTLRKMGKIKTGPKGERYHAVLVMGKKGVRVKLAPKNTAKHFPIHDLVMEGLRKKHKKKPPVGPGPILPAP